MRPWSSCDQSYFSVVTDRTVGIGWSFWTAKISSSYGGHTSGFSIMLPFSCACGCKTIWVIAYESEILSIYANATAENAINADTIRWGMMKPEYLVEVK